MTADVQRRPLVDWRELFRVANVFTAASNAVAGFLLVQGQWQPVTMLAMLVLASILFYEAGMALNDAFDAPLDAVEPAGRPIPSGRITRREAFGAGWLLLAGGGTFAAIVSWRMQSANSLIIGACLALAIVMYDGGLKATAAGPWAMGWCRVLCVLLGASVATDLSTRPWPWVYAVLVGAYTVGLTYVARGETQGTAADMLRKRVGVTRLIQGFIVMDAIAVTIAAGWPSGLTVLALLAPTLLLARRVAMT